MVSGCLNPECSLLRCRSERPLRSGLKLFFSVKSSGLIQISRYSSLPAHSVKPGRSQSMRRGGFNSKSLPPPPTSALSDPLGPELLLLRALVLETGGVGPENITMGLGWREVCFYFRLCHLSRDSRNCNPQNRGCFRSLGLLARHTGERRQPNRRDERGSGGRQEALRAPSPAHSIHFGFYCALLIDCSKRRKS